MIVVADTSVLLLLCRVGLGELFNKLFDEVVIPPEVAAEFQWVVTSSSIFAGLKLPVGIRQQAPTLIPPIVRAVEGLPTGHSAAVSLAVEIKADAVLIDERRGQEVARLLGLRRIGVFAILLRAKAANYLPAIEPILDALQRDAGCCIVEPLRQNLLDLAGE